MNVTFSFDNHFKTPWHLTDPGDWWVREFSV